MEDRDELRRTAESFRHLFATEHPAADTTLVAFVDGTLEAGEREVVDEHLAGCVVCRQDVADLRSVQASLRAMPRQPFRPWLLAAALAAFALLAVVAYLQRPVQQTPVLRTYGRMEWDALVREARGARRLAPPPAWIAVQTTPDIVRGSQGVSVAGSFAPSGTVLVNQQPEFTWPAVDRAAYVVRVSAGT